MGAAAEDQAIVEALTGAKPIFVLPRDELMPTLVPAIGASSQLNCMRGFFASSSLAEIAPGLATFLKKADAPMRLIVSPFITPADQSALRDGADPKRLVEDAFAGKLPEADDLTRHKLACLSWLIRRRRLEMRFAFMRAGLFHPKVWLLNVAGNRLAFHGSVNMTGPGLGRNKEQVALARAWMNPSQAETERRLRLEFDDLWDGDDEDCLVVVASRTESSFLVGAIVCLACARCACEAVLSIATTVLPSGPGAFAPPVLLRILAINATALGLVLAAHRLVPAARPEHPRSAASRG